MGFIPCKAEQPLQGIELKEKKEKKKKIIKHTGNLIRRNLTSIHLCNVSVQTCFVYLKCENVVYWYTIIICQNQLTIFIPTRSTTIADYSGINYLLQVLVFLVKIGILSTVSGSKKSKFNIF